MRLWSFDDMLLGVWFNCLATLWWSYVPETGLRALQVGAYICCLRQTDNLSPRLNQDQLSTLKCWAKWLHQHQKWCVDERVVALWHEIPRQTHPVTVREVKVSCLSLCNGDSTRVERMENQLTWSSGTHKEGKRGREREERQSLRFSLKLSRNFERQHLWA